MRPPKLRQGDHHDKPAPVLFTARCNSRHWTRLGVPTISDHAGAISRLQFCLPNGMPAATGEIHILNHVTVPRRGEARLFESIFLTLQKPGGFRLLSPQQRKQLIAAILACVIPSDGKVLTVEIERLTEHLRSRFNFSGAEIEAVLNQPEMILEPGQIAIVIKHLGELFGPEDMATLVGLMWDIAMCDHELHPLEESLIYQLADGAGLARKLVIQQQMKAQRTNRAAP